MRRIGLIVALLALGACAKPPLHSTQSNNREIKIDELFTHRGVTVYRFTDGGRNVYFTSRGDATALHSESCGKGCVNEVIVQTLNGAWVGQ